MGRRRAARRLAAFRASERASAVVEFAVVCPVLLVFMLMGLQLIGYVDATRKVERIADAASEMISQQQPPKGSTTGLITGTDVHFGYDSSVVIFPELMSDAARQGVAWSQDIEVDFAGVQFNKVRSNCTDPTNLSACYTPQVLWTSTIGPHVRSCSTPMKPQSNTASTNMAYLPKSVFGPGGLIVIDVYFTYHPSFASNLLPAITIVRSAYVQPRYATLIKLDTSNTDYIASACPGIS